MFYELTLSQFWQFSYEICQMGGVFMSESGKPRKKEPLQRFFCFCLWKIKRTIAFHCALFSGSHPKKGDISLFRLLYTEIFCSDETS